MIIVIQCTDQLGLVAAISGILAEQKINIVSLREHVDKVENRFFMRLETEQTADIALLETKMRSVLPADSIIAINPLPEKKIVVMVSKEYHCLADILTRNYFGTLGASVQCVIGNHTILEDFCRRYDIPFFPVQFEQHDRPGFEQKIIDIIKQHNPDYIVLAKFMRVLSPAFVEQFPTRIINIHHSFLPAFIGASPYRQAYERGVKLIGATAHFVTNDLDQGPIIEQQISQVNHSHRPEDMIRAGREVETSVLAKALQLVFDDRVIVYQNKTIVFS
jgi:formyltetrahydrofolate deformylase